MSTNSPNSVSVDYAMPGTSAMGTNSNNNGEVAMPNSGTTVAHTGHNTPQSLCASTRSTYVCGPSLPAYHLRSGDRIRGTPVIPSTPNVARTTAAEMNVPRPMVTMVTTDSDETSLMYSHPSSVQRVFDPPRTTATHAMQNARSSVDFPHSMATIAVQNARSVETSHISRALPTHIQGEPRLTRSDSYLSGDGVSSSNRLSNFGLSNGSSRLSNTRVQQANSAPSDAVNSYMMDTMQQLAASVNQLTASMTQITTTVSDLSHEVNHIRNAPPAREDAPFIHSSRASRQVLEPAARVSLHLPKFTGKGDFVSFEAHFKNVAYQSHWSDETSAVMLSCALEAQAQQFYARLPEPDRYNYQWLLQTLGKRFSKSCPDVQKEALLGRVRQTSESMAELRDDIWRLVQEAYPDMDYVFQEMMALDALKRAVDQQLRLRFIDKNVKTLQEAVDVAEIYESVMRSSISTRKTVRAVKPDDQTVRPTVRFQDQMTSGGDDLRQEMSTIQTTLREPQKAVDVLTKSSERNGRNMSDHRSPSRNMSDHRSPSRNMDSRSPSRNMDSRSPSRNMAYSRSPSPNPRLSRNNNGFKSPKPGRSSLRDTITCFRCGEIGHWANECVGSRASETRPRETGDDATSQGNGQPPARA
jgi:hypothetical protein